MKDGVVVESGSPHDIFRHPQHPYTRDLIASIPEFDPASFAATIAN
jgi:oligopeptide/dipeptide ABC transporter ATP-binding protein